MAAGDPRMTLPTQHVISYLIEHADDELYGLEIVRGVGLPSGTVHPILARLEGMKWVESRWEEADPRDEKRPRRRYYRLTGAGAMRARAALARAEARRPGIAALRPGIAGGAS